MVEKNIMYFDETGQQNTDQVFELSRKRAEELKINTILVATSIGNTGAKAVKALGGYKLVIITHSYGFKGPNHNELTDDNRAIIEQAGATIFTGMHAFSSLSRTIGKAKNTFGVDDMVSSTLRIFGQGTKVCVEIALMASDAGLVEVNKPCIAIAGSGHGADTALVLTPVNMRDFFDLKVHEIIAKPALYA